MRVLVCGGRRYHNRARVYSALNKVDADFGITCVIHGACTGADELAGRWARISSKEERAYPADWKKLGRKAGPIRNDRMLMDGKPDIVLAFPGGIGTEDMVRKAERKGVVVLAIS